MNNQSVNLVVYFSAENNTTRRIAQILAQNVFANLLEIKPKEPYTSKDLDWRRFFSRCNKEHRRKIMPEIEAPGVDLTKYSVIFLGFPIWYGKAPNIVKSFLRLHDWSGQKIVLFATSGGSGIEKAYEDLKKTIGSHRIIGSRMFDDAVDWDDIGEWGSSIIEGLSGGLKHAAEEYIEQHYVALKEPENNDANKLHFSRATADNQKASVSLSGGARFSRDFSEEAPQSELERLRKENEMLIRRQQEINRRLGYTATRSPLDRYNPGGVQRTMSRTNAQASRGDILNALDSYTDQSFVGKMMSLIRQKGLKEPDVYRAAQIDRRLFSRIISDQDYKPAKDTCIALAYALKLNLNEATDFLSRAGYAFSHSNKRDVILEYFFNAGKYDLFDINEVLFQLNQRPLGRQS